MPTVSVLMVCHHDQPFLRPAIASVLHQTFRDLELVLVDNGAGLSGAALAELGCDPRLRWVRFPRNMGIPAAHNAAVAAAAGEFVALLDHDDLMRPARLERQVAALQAEPNLGLLSSLAERIDAAGTVVGREFALIQPEAQRVYSQYAAPVVTPAYTGRREVFATFAYREEFPFSADFDFLARAAEQWMMAAIPEVLLQYRWHIGQATQVHGTVIEQSRCQIRLATARRRAGRPEELAALVASGRAAVPSAAQSCRAMAGQCLAEDFPALAAYHARRSFALERTPASGVAACRLAARALANARGPARTLATRLFLMGPVKALRLRPA